MIVIDDYSPIFAGDTLQGLYIQFQTKQGKAIPIPAGATLTLVMACTTPGNVIRRQGTGTWTITGDGSSGQAGYQYSMEDVEVAGTWDLQVTMTVGGKPQHFDMKSLVILPPL